MGSVSNHRVLVIDTEIDSSKMLADMMRAESCDTTIAANIDEAGEHLQRAVYDIVFLDPAVDEENAFSFLNRLKKEYSAVRGIIVSGKKTTDLAIKALRAGTFDFLTKPLHLSEVQRTLQRAVESIDSARIRTSRERFSGSSRKARDRKLIGKSPKMKELRGLIDTVAASGATVLIRGESGTGKELVAQALHFQSPRNKGPLVPVNCGAIPEDLLESELFGHVRGAFTGAVRDRAGRFVLANGGTIFLDEIGDMSPKLQVKVLRVLQEQELEPVGGGQTVNVDVRVLAATNVDLERAVEERRFREDLYYRLNVVPIDVPPLRERTEDLERLISHFINIFNKRQDRQIASFAPETVEILKHNPWNGNVRELENLVERMMILARGEVVLPDDLPPKFLDPQVSTRVATPQAESLAAVDGVTQDERLAFRMGAAAEAQAAEPVFPVEVPVAQDVTLSDLVDDYERTLILDALEKNNGVKSRAARHLGIKRTTLVEKMKKKNIEYEKD